MSNIGGPTNTPPSSNNNTTGKTNKGESAKAFGKSVRTEDGGSFIPRPLKQDNTPGQSANHLKDRSSSHWYTEPSNDDLEQQVNSHSTALGAQDRQRDLEAPGRTTENLRQDIPVSTDNLPVQNKPRDASISSQTGLLNPMNANLSVESKQQLSDLKNDITKVKDSYPDGASQKSSAKKKWLGKLKNLCNKVLNFISNNKLTSIAGALLIVGLLMTIPVAGQFFGASLLATLTFSMGMILICSSMGLTISNVISPEGAANNPSEPTQAQNNKPVSQPQKAEPVKPINETGSEEDAPLTEKFSLDGFKTWINHYPSKWLNEDKLVPSLEAFTSGGLSENGKNESYNRLLNKFDRLTQLVESPLNGQAGEGQQQRIEQIQDVMTGALTFDADLELDDLLGMLVDFGGLIESYKRFYPGLDQRQLLQSPADQGPKDIDEKVIEATERLKGIESALRNEVHKRMPRVNDQSFSSGSGEGVEFFPSTADKPLQGIYPEKVIKQLNQGQNYATPGQTQELMDDPIIKIKEYPEINFVTEQSGPKLNYGVTNFANDSSSAGRPSGYKVLFDQLDLSIRQDPKNQDEFLQQIEGNTKLNASLPNPDHNLLGTTMVRFFIELDNAKNINWLDPNKKNKQQEVLEDIYKIKFNKDITDRSSKNYCEQSLKLVTHTIKKRAFKVLGISEGENNTFEQNKTNAIASTNDSVKGLFSNQSERLVVKEDQREMFIELLLDGDLGEGVPTVNDAFELLNTSDKGREFMKEYIRQIMKNNWRKELI